MEATILSAEVLATAAALLPIAIQATVILLVWKFLDWLYDKFVQWNTNYKTFNFQLTP